MNALPFGLCFDTKSLARCYADRAERHPLISKLRYRVEKLPRR